MRKRYHPVRQIRTVWAQVLFYRLRQATLQSRDALTVLRDDRAQPIQRPYHWRGRFALPLHDAPTGMAEADRR